MAPEHNLNHGTKDYPFMTCLVKVNTQSYWQKTVAQVLNKCHAVYSFRMDDNGEVEISGKVDPSLLLKMLGKAGRRAELRWFQFGECSSNLFLPTNHRGSIHSQDGRYLHSGNISGPKIPSQEPLGAQNRKHDYQIAYDQKHDYDQYALQYNHHSAQSYDHNHDYRLGCDQKNDYPQDYYRDYGYLHSYDPRHDYQQYDRGHDYQYNSGYGRGGTQTQYNHILPTRGGEDMGCCRVM